MQFKVVPRIYVKLFKPSALRSLVVGMYFGLVMYDRAVMRWFISLELIITSNYQADYHSMIVVKKFQQIDVIEFKV